MIVKYDELIDEIKLIAMVVDELPKRGRAGTIYWVRDNKGQGYHQCIWMKKIHISFKDWIFRRTHEWVNIGYEDEVDHDWAIIKIIDEEE